jgi:hypothetical protein
MEQSPSLNQILAKPGKKLSAFYETSIFITVFTKVGSWGRLSPIRILKVHFNNPVKVCNNG